jgi:hypothetical protein
MTVSLIRKIHSFLRPDFRRIAGWILFLAVIFPAGAATTTSLCKFRNRGADLLIPSGQWQQDTTDVLYVRIYRDSVRKDTSGFQQMEARVEGERILSLFIDGREIPEKDYEFFATPLIERLDKEKRLKNELFSLMNEITGKEKELDSLHNAMIVVEGQPFDPEEDLQEQILSFLTGKEAEKNSVADSVPALPPMVPDEKIRHLSDEIMNIKTIRLEKAQALEEDINMLRQEEERIRREIENIDAVFSVEKVTVGGQPEQSVKSVKEKKRWFKRRKKRKH